MEGAGLTAIPASLGSTTLATPRVYDVNDTKEGGTILRKYGWPIALFMVIPVVSSFSEGIAFSALGVDRIS